LQQLMAYEDSLFGSISINFYADNPSDWNISGWSTG
jgi:hypothetical protein